MKARPADALAGALPTQDIETRAGDRGSSGMTRCGVLFHAEGASTASSHAEKGGDGVWVRAVILAPEPVHGSARPVACTSGATPVRRGRARTPGGKDAAEERAGGLRPLSAAGKRAKSRCGRKDALPLPPDLPAGTGTHGSSTEIPCRRGPTPVKALPIWERNESEKSDIHVEVNGS